MKITRGKDRAECISFSLPRETGSGSSRFVRAWRIVIAISIVLDFYDSVISALLPAHVEKLYSYFKKNPFTHEEYSPLKKRRQEDSILTLRVESCKRLAYDIFLSYVKEIV